jgi:F-type H+-transporting ATPase subunit epsilon
MASTFKFELVSPEKLLVSGDAEQVVLQGTDGDMTVFAGHAPVISTLRPGLLDVELAGAKTRFFIKGGFTEIGPERVTVLAQKAIDVADLTGSRISHEVELAEAELAEAKDDDARHFAQTAIDQLKGFTSKAA